MTGFELPDCRTRLARRRLSRTRTRLRVVPTTAELLLERASFVPGQVVPLFEVRPPVLTGLEWAVKRTFDIVVAAFLILVLATPAPARRAGSCASRARGR